MTRIVSRLLLPPVVARRMPALLALLFAVSQLDAIVDVAGTARAGRALPFWVRAVLLGGAVAAGSAEVRTVLREVVYSDRTSFLWASALDDRALGRAFAPTLAFGAIPVGLLALLLGPGPALAASVGGTVAGGAVAAGAWGPWVAVCAGTGLLAGPWGLLAPLGLPLAFGPVGRWLRDGRPRGDAAPRASWMGRSPTVALIARDALGVWRTHPRGTVALGVLQLLGVAFVLSAMQRSWGPAEVTVAGLVAVGFVGTLPAVALGIASDAVGPTFHERSLPNQDHFGPFRACAAERSALRFALTSLSGPTDVPGWTEEHPVCPLLAVRRIGRPARVLGLWVLAVATLAPTLIGASWSAPAAVPAMAALASGLGAVGVWGACHPVPRRRREAAGPALAASVFLPILAAAMGPIAPVVVAVLALAAARWRLAA